MERGWEVRSGSRDNGVFASPLLLQLLAVVTLQYVSTHGVLNWFTSGSCWWMLFDLNRSCLLLEYTLVPSSFRCKQEFLLGCTVRSLFVNCCQLWDNTLSFEHRLVAASTLVLKEIELKFTCC